MEYFIQNNIERTTGKNEMVTFFDLLSKYTITFLKKYYDNFPSQLKEHGFQYGEEQTKTFLTLALGKLTNCYFIQENPIDRKFIDKNQKKYTTIGWTDYWAKYENATYLIEIKDSTIRYHPKTESFTFYRNLQKLLNYSIEQIDNVNEKFNYNYSKRLIGLGLVVAPIFYSLRPKDITPDLRFNNRIRENLIENAYKIGSNICAFWRLPNNYLIKPEISTDEKFGFIGLAFIGKFITMTEE